MNRILIFGVMILIAGCELTTNPSTSDRSNREKISPAEQPLAADIWQALAAAIERKSIRSTTQLAQIVVSLRRNESLSKADQARFEAAWPDLLVTDRELTVEDIDRLKGLK